LRLGDDAEQELDAPIDRLGALRMLGRRRLRLDLRRRLPAPVKQRVTCAEPEDENRSAPHRSQRKTSAKRVLWRVGGADGTRKRVEYKFDDPSRASGGAVAAPASETPRHPVDAPGVSPSLGQSAEAFAPGDNVEAALARALDAAVAAGRLDAVPSIVEELRSR